MRGPIDYIVVGFDGNNFKGDILRELVSAQEKGTIAVLDLALVVRDTDGTVSSIEITDTQGLGVSGGFISEEDVEEVGDILEDNTSAGLLIIEHLWAKNLKQAIKDAGGVLITDGRIHPEAVKELDNKEDK